VLQHKINGIKTTVYSVRYVLLNMKIIVLIVVYLITFSSIRSQIATEYGAPIKWDQNFDRTKYMMIGLDTITNDSILIYRDKYIRQNEKGLILEELIFSNLNIVSCYDEGPKLSGYWTRNYETGEIKEIGKIICNRKYGDWLYFYKSGQIKKYEKYDGLDLIDSNPNIGYLNGTYLEYHPNGKIKTTGAYKFIEENVPYYTFDAENYEEVENCCIWVPKSIKFGEWVEYDNLGEIQESKVYNITVKDSTNLRELTDRYLGIDINELKKR
jgi:antitoxin component YwqK of YwqJK toxin-antitoxin module